MPNRFTLDHAVLVVPDLISGGDLFSRLGFTVTPGGVHAGGLTHNALIPFQDGSYLELLAAVQPASLHLLRPLRTLGLLGLHPAGKTRFSRRFIDHLLIGPGINDYALACTQLDQAVGQAAGRGMILDGPHPGGRVRPDGQQVSWRTASPPTLDLPFLIDDLTPHQLRVPAGTACQHPNRLVGIEGIYLLVEDLPRGWQGYSQLLALDPDRAGVVGMDTASETFYLGTMHITLLDVNTQQNAGTLSSYLASRPGRPCALQLRTDQGQSQYLVYDSSRGYILTTSGRISTCKSGDDFALRQ